MECPKCKSTQLRKNGHSSGRQRYLCKACGKQFLAPLSLLGLPSADGGKVQVANQKCFSNTASAPSTLSPPDVSVSPLNGVVTATQSTQGIAILLLDAENLRLDIKAEKFLAELSNYPIQVKIAFANWRNHAIGKLDAELYDRGYQLIHVPIGQNSADAQMIAMGASISRHYPDAKEVFVCSCDWLLTHLCNELQSQGMTVYRIRRQDNTLSVENRNTEEIKHYSLTIGTEIPSLDKFINKIEDLLNTERESITERIAQLSTVATLFQERCNLMETENRVNSSAEPQNLTSIPTGVEQKSTPPLPEKMEVESNNSVATTSSPLNRSINSKEEFEQALVEIIASMKANSPLEQVSVTKLSAALQLMCGETANAIVKKLKLGGNFTKFLQACPTFKLEKTGTNPEVILSNPNS